METTLVVSMTLLLLVSGQSVKEALETPATLTKESTVGSAAMASATDMPFPATRAKAVKPPF